MSDNKPDTKPEAKPVGTPSPTSVVVDVKANLSLSGQTVAAGDTGVTLPDTAEVRACIAAGLLDEVSAAKK